MGSSSEKGNSTPRKTFRMTAEEITVIVRALQKHRNSIPLYLQSMHAELDLIDGLLRRME